MLPKYEGIPIEVILQYLYANYGLDYDVTVSALRRPNDKHALRNASQLVLSSWPST